MVIVFAVEKATISQFGAVAWRYQLIPHEMLSPGQRVTGHWLGLGAQRLGLTSKVGAEAFLRLSENRHPASGQTLTQRLNTTRTDGAGNHTANRRIFYDFTFSPPKSVSVAALVGADERILTAHAQAVRLAMKEFEAFPCSRYRRILCTELTP